jgi:hypothetical protein
MNPWGVCCGVLIREVGILGRGECFGTYSCLLGEPRAATVVSVSYSELYSLARKDLEEVVSRWPELGENFSVLGEKGVLKSGNNEEDHHDHIPYHDALDAYTSWLWSHLCVVMGLPRTSCLPTYAHVP